VNWLNGWIGKVIDPSSRGEGSSGVAVGGLRRFGRKELTPLGIERLAGSIYLNTGASAVTLDDKAHPFIATVAAMPR
jgi:hypothetical protein